MGNPRYNCIDLCMGLMKHSASSSDLTSWGNLFHPKQRVFRPSSREESLGLLGQAAPKVLPYGLGRSYGDSCINDGGALLHTCYLDHFIAFDPSTGVLSCEAGVTLAEILEVTLPRGWFLPVTPGTKFVTVGGAIANDVHGKNHHQDGTFGHAVRALELVRSDGTLILCSPTQLPSLFRATIGGLGLTGLITRAEIQLSPVAGPLILEEKIKFGNLDEFFSLSHESASTHQYVVSWIDCLAKGPRLGRGIFIRGNHAPKGYETSSIAKRKHLQIPFYFPSWALGPWSVRAFNELYFHKQLRKIAKSTSHYDPFFYPLDTVHHWNRIYGPRGFYQYQCVVPGVSGKHAIRQILTEISKAGIGSFLAVLKMFGPKPSLGMLSFPREGVTLALDFPNTGPAVLSLFDRLDKIVLDHSGALYPAKDARMTGDTFRAGYPEWKTFSEFVDPGFSSSFWRRVTEDV